LVVCGAGKRGRKKYFFLGLALADDGIMFTFAARFGGTGDLGRNVQAGLTVRHHIGSLTHWHQDE